MSQSPQTGDWLGPYAPQTFRSEISKRERELMRPSEQTNELLRPSGTTTRRGLRQEKRLNRSLNQERQLRVIHWDRTDIWVCATQTGETTGCESESLTSERRLSVNLSPSDRQTSKCESNSKPLRQGRQSSSDRRPERWLHHQYLLEVSVLQFVSRYRGKAQQPQEQRYPFLSVCVVFSCVQTMVWLPVFGIFNVRTDVDACDCTRRLYGHRKRVCAESWLWSLKENTLPHRGSNPRQYFALAFQLDALPTELSTLSWWMCVV